jgi:hypothetical protein
MKIPEWERLFYIIRMEYSTCIGPKESNRSTISPNTAQLIFIWSARRNYGIAFLKMRGNGVGDKMHILISEEEARDVIKILADCGRPNAALQLLEEIEMQLDPELDKYRDAVKRIDLEELEIDDKGPVSVSDEGAYVQCWIWVSKREIS